MTYGDFAWNDLLGRDRDNPSRRPDRRTNTFIEGEPVPWMDFGEDDWCWQISRVVRKPLLRPNLRFVVSRLARAGRRYSIDDYAKPVLDVVAQKPRSVWVRMAEGDRPGVTITDVAPPFPPRIDRVLEVPFRGQSDDAAQIKQALKKEPVIAGEQPLGIHLGIGRFEVGDFDYGGPVRVLFDGLSETLGGTLGSPGDLRIRELRVTREPGRIDGAEVRVWVMD